MKHYNGFLPPECHYGNTMSIQWIRNSLSIFSDELSTWSMSSVGATAATFLSPALFFPLVLVFLPSSSAMGHKATVCPAHLGVSRIHK